MKSNKIGFSARIYTFQAQNKITNITTLAKVAQFQILITAIANPFHFYDN